jgi:hypothetical protein
MIKRTIGLAALFALTACSQGSDENIAIDNAVNAAESANADVEVLPADETAVIDEADNADSIEPSPPGTLGASMIPAQYHGRWGMNAADCDPSRSDNKGLITVGDKTVRFYESTATLKEQRPAIATSFSGLFGFTGEGQTWEKVMTFTRTGDTLKRAEEDGSYTYKRCS